MHTHPAPRPLILDTDIGSDIDDTFALIMALNAPELDLRLVSTASGDTAYRAELTAAILTAAGREDIPVAVGLAQEWPASHRTQAGWLARQAGRPPAVKIHADGVDVLIRTIRTAPAPVTLLCIGPLTNIGAALAKAPDIAPRCRFMGMMGSIDKGYEGRPGTVAEYNIVTDPAAARAVFAAPWHSAAITPLDSCGVPLFGGERLRRLLASPLPRARILAENILSWNEHKTWPAGYSLEESLTPFDAVAVYMTYAGEHLAFEDLRLSISDQGLLRRDPAGSPFRVAMGWRDEAAYMEHFTERLLRA